MVEKEKVGGTCLHGGCIPAKELLETAHVYRTVAGAAGVRHRAPASPRSTSSVTQARKQKVIDQLVEGPHGPAQEPQGHDATTAPGRSAPTAPCTVERRRVGRRRARPATHVILAAGSVPRTIPGFDVDGTLVVTSDEVLSISELPDVGGGDRRRRHRLRVRVDDGRPRHARSRSSRRCPRSSPAATTTSPRSCCARSRSAASTSAPACRSPATSPAATAAPPSSSATASRSRSTWSSCRSAGGRCSDIARARRHRRSRSTSAASSRSTSTCRTGEPGVWAVGDLIATPAAGPRRLRRGDRRDQGHPRRGPAARSTTAGCRGASTATPRSPSPATPSRVGQGGRLRRRRVEAPLHRQRPGDDRRRAPRAW